MYHHEHWMNYRELWTGWPNREITGMMKWYYLVQFSFWLQQIVTVNIEERRKDHWQMFTHHIVTCTLMFWSYGYHWTKVGNLILCLMDVVDWLLAVRLPLDDCDSILMEGRSPRYSSTSNTKHLAMSPLESSWLYGSLRAMCYTSRS